MKSVQGENDTFLQKEETKIHRQKYSLEKILPTTKIAKVRLVVLALVLAIVGSYYVTHSNKFPNLMGIFNVGQGNMQPNTKESLIASTPNLPIQPTVYPTLNRTQPCERLFRVLKIDPSSAGVLVNVGDKVCGFDEDTAEYIYQFTLPSGSTTKRYLATVYRTKNNENFYTLYQDLTVGINGERYELTFYVDEGRGVGCAPDSTEVGCNSESYDIEITDQMSLRVIQYNNNTYRLVIYANNVSQYGSSIFITKEQSRGDVENIDDINQIQGSFSQSEIDLWKSIASTIQPFDVSNSIADLP